MTRIVSKHLSAEARSLRRHARAERTRARALSPGRVVLRLLALPGLMLAVAVSVYLRTSPYEVDLALRHLAARAGCDAARTVGLAPARAGAPGYHARNDRDGDGVACDAASAQVAAAPGATDPMRGSTRYVGGAKFVRP